MRCCILLCAALILYSPTLFQERDLPATQPKEFEIGRRTFFDFGPPFDFYEIFIVRPATRGTSIERITLTPAADECIAPAKVETASASIDEPVAALLGSSNPCTIPEESLRRELKRCKDCLVFSGAKVVMQVQCGSRTRLVRSDILDQDMFDPSAHPPQHTSWTMRLLERLDQAVGPGVMDKPAFPVSDPQEVPPSEFDSPNLRGVRDGNYDALFPDAPDKPSLLYRAAQNRPPSPSVRLLSSVPLSPEVFVLPDYPLLARMARVGGEVSFTIEIDANGGVANLAIESGHPILRAAVKKVVNEWKFPKDDSSRQIHAMIEFILNCPKPAE